MVKYVDKRGVKRVKGSSNMKKSQNYPLPRLGAKLNVFSRFGLRRCFPDAVFI